VEVSSFHEGANERMAKDRIDRNELADKLVETATAAEDPLRAMAEMIADFVMEAQGDGEVGAEPHERTVDRTTHRNGCRERRWDTRLGSLTLNVPKQTVLFARQSLEAFGQLKRADLSF
jgi:transposase-like protein